MTIMTIEDMFKQNANSDGIPMFDKNAWADLNANYTKTQIKIGLADYIVKYKPKFPYMIVTYDSMKKRFYSLKNKNATDFLITNFNDVVEKYDDYKYPFSTYGKLVIGLTNKYNPISNYFQQHNRMTCGSYGFESPIDIWNSKTLLEKMNWTFWRLGNTSLGACEYRGSFRLGSYVATQFKPNVAKCIYQLTKAKVVCDTSCGWGDRLAGFYATPNAESYYGCDPNEVVFETYKTQCIEYEKLLGHTAKLVEHNGWFECIGSKHVVIFRQPAEDVVWPNVEFDCTFTSPPYFSTEQYNKGGEHESDQSWSRYSDYDKWKNGFYFPMMDSVWNKTKSGGFVCINIMDPQVKGKRHRACDDLVDHMIAKPDCHFLGQIGMRIKQRPKNIGALNNKKHLSNIFIENIWCFSKDRVSSFHTPTLESLFI